MWFKADERNQSQKWMKPIKCDSFVSIMVEANDFMQMIHDILMLFACTFRPHEDE